MSFGFWDLGYLEDKALRYNSGAAWKKIGGSNGEENKQLGEQEQ